MLELVSQIQHLSICRHTGIGWRGKEREEVRGEDNVNILCSDNICVFILVMSE